MGVKRVAVRAKSYKIRWLVPSAVLHPSYVMEFKGKYVPARRTGALVASLQQNDVARGIRDAGAWHGCKCGA